MPTKRRDPVLPVLAYFQDADLPLAKQALALANAIVRRRTPALPKKPATNATSPRKPNPTRAEAVGVTPN